MDKYGINNIRGKSFVSVKLKKFMIDTLKQMSNGTNNKYFVCEKERHFVKECKENESDEIEDSKECNDCCFRCDREGHFISCCYASKHINRHYLNDKVWCCEYHEKNYKSKNKKQLVYEIVDCCFCYGSEGLYSTSCYA